MLKEAEAHSDNAQCRRPPQAKHLKSQHAGQAAALYALRRQLPLPNTSVAVLYGDYHVHTSEITAVTQAAGWKPAVQLMLLACTCTSISLKLSLWLNLLSRTSCSLCCPSCSVRCLPGSLGLRNQLQVALVRSCYGPFQLLLLLTGVHLQHTNTCVITMQ